MTTINKRLLTKLVKVQLDRNTSVLSELFQSSSDLTPNHIKASLKGVLHSMPPYETETIKDILLDYALENLDYNFLTDSLIERFSVL